MPVSVYRFERHNNASTHELEQNKGHTLPEARLLFLFDCDLM